MNKIDFQPMPKRFMVWDTVGKEFIIINHKGKVGTIEDIVREFQYNPYAISQYSIIQSTNLFDKDGKKIFEEDIVRVGGETGVVQMVNGEWHAVGDDDIPLSVWEPTGIGILGHILSNPELLEEK